MKTCGLDVHKDMIFCAIYDGKESEVKKYDTFTPDLEEMCDHIKSQGVETVAMESTGIYINAIRTVFLYNGMLNDSFIPDGVLAQLRVYTRDYRRSVQRRDSVCNYRGKIRKFL